MRADNSITSPPPPNTGTKYTRAKAIAALHELDQAGTAITFEAVADHAGVSRSWLYTQPDLKDEIRRLRSMRSALPPTQRLPHNVPARNRCGNASISPPDETAS